MWRSKRALETDLDLCCYDMLACRGRVDDESDDDESVLYVYVCVWIYSRAVRTIASRAVVVDRCQ